MSKFLVERFFRNSDVAVLLVFTGLIGLVPLPFVALLGISVVPSISNILLISLSGGLYMGVILLYLQALQNEEASVIFTAFSNSAHVCLWVGIVYFARSSILASIDSRCADYGEHIGAGVW